MSSSNHFPLATTASDRKPTIRRELLCRRRALERSSWLTMSSAVLGRLFEMPELAAASKIHCYVSMESEREVSTMELLERLHQERKVVYMPYIDREGMATVAYQAGQRFTAQASGPPAPDPVVMSKETGFDIVIVPIVGADPEGHRLGYGKGWYDRFFEALARLGAHPVRIGLAFGFQVLDALPADPWDQLLDYVVTESGIINCMAGRA